MKSLIEKIYVISFLCMLTIPSVCWIFREESEMNMENRTLASWPVWREHAVSDWTSLFEEYYNDHLPYKNKLTTLNAMIDLYGFKNLNSNSVMLGKENWLFFKEENCIQDYKGEIELSDDIITNCTESLLKLDEYAKENDIKFVFMITPNKEEVCGNRYMPDYVSVKNETSRADELIEYLEANTDIIIVYPKEVLRENFDSGINLWNKYDTHWNSIGALIATQELLKVVDKRIYEISDLYIYEYGFETGDLAKMAGLGNVLVDDVMYGIAAYEENVQTEMVYNIPESNLNHTLWKSNAICDDKIMMIGDSFLGLMESYIASHYAEAEFCHRSNYQGGQITKMKPDVLVIQSAERFIDNLGLSIDEILVKENIITEE